jgi:glycosyltransferase 2 family protein
MKILFRILLYLSLIFFVWHLYRTDLLVPDNITFDAAKLLLSLLLLFAGFIVVCLSWGMALRLSGIRVRFSAAVASQGIYIFSKYIPGKLWLIMGRASYFSRDGKSLRLLSMISLREQLVFLWWGLALSLPATHFILQNAAASFAVTAGVIILSFSLFSGWFHKRSSGLLKIIFKRDFGFRPMELGFFLRISVPVLLFWLLWTAGFHLFMLSVYDGVQPLLALAFPAGMTYGFMVVFMPAGIGVREGIMATFLTIGGLQAETAVTISTMSRLWFVTGELFLFTLAWIIRLSGDKGADYPEYPSKSQT